MNICTFFGHRDCPQTVYPLLVNAITTLIETENVFKFYVGNHGNFDFMVIRALKELISIYPQIKIYIVLAYIPREICITDSFILDNSIIPEGIETVPKKFAISYRNKWLVENSHIVITYITRPFGGAAQFALLAKKNKKRIINLV